MKFIIKILENYWSKERQIAYNNMKRFHKMYLEQKHYIETSKDHFPILLGKNFLWDNAKAQSEDCHEQYLYWKKRLKKIKAKLSKLQKKV